MLQITSVEEITSPLDPKSFTYLKRIPVYHSMIMYVMIRVKDDKVQVPGKIHRRSMLSFIPKD